MSRATDAKSYADAAIEAVIEQGKQALDAAQAGLGKLQSNAKSLDANALSVESIRAAVEPHLAPYLAKAKDYGIAVTGKAEAVVGDLRKDKRIAQVIDSTEALATALLGVVQERVVKPASSAASKAPFTSSPFSATTSTGRATRKPAASKPASAATTTRPATTRPAAAKPTAAKSAGSKSAESKPTAS
jgi:hypothetical protein